MKEIFVSTCIVGTATLIEGKDYEVISDDNWKIMVINENGNHISVVRDRFAEIKLKDVKKNVKLTIICKEAGPFKNLVAGKSYEVVETTENYYYVLNAKGSKVRYGKKYFVPPAEGAAKVSTAAKVREKPAPPPPPKVVANCIHPIVGEISYKKNYEFEEVANNPLLISLKNDQNLKAEYLKTRFKIQ